jgi:hypothetical protein
MWRALALSWRKMSQIPAYFNTAMMIRISCETLVNSALTILQSNIVADEA